MTHTPSKWLIRLGAAVLLATAPCAAVSGAAEPRPAAIVPLFDRDTVREPDTTIQTSDAVITRIADRVRDRHAREPGAYDHFLSWYWEERTVTIELVDRVLKGGAGVVILSLIHI